MAARARVCGVTLARAFSSIVSATVNRIDASSQRDDATTRRDARG